MDREPQRADDLVFWNRPVAALLLFVFVLSLLAWAAARASRRRAIPPPRTQELVDQWARDGSLVVALVDAFCAKGSASEKPPRGIDMGDAQAVMAALAQVSPSAPVLLVLHTLGGEITALAAVAEALSRHRGRVTVYVPYYALSGGALLALSADEIAMGRDAFLGAADPQVLVPAPGVVPSPRYQASDVVAAAAATPGADPSLASRAAVLEASRAVASVAQLGRRLLLARGVYTPEQARSLVAELASGQRRLLHSMPIPRTEARALGLRVSDEAPPPVAFDIVDSAVRQLPCNPHGVYISATI